MTAQLVMTQDQIDADRDGWLAARQQGIGASEIAQVLDICPPRWGSAHSLYLDKKRGGDGFQNRGMKFGQFAEAYVADEVAEQRPDLKVLPGGLYRSAERPWQMATPDRLTAHGVPVQCKTSGSMEEWGSDPDDGAVPPYYLAQVMQEIDVMDAPGGYLAVLFLWSRDTRIYKIPRDDEDIAFIRHAGELFMKRLANDDPPPVDWSPATTRSLGRMYPDLVDDTVRVTKALAGEYFAAKKAVSRAQSRLGLAENRLRAAMGPVRRAAVQVDGPDGPELVVVAERRRYEQTRIEGRRVRERHPRIFKRFSKTSMVDGLWQGPWVP